MENLIQLAVSGQVIEISGQAFVRNEEGELVPLELQQGLIGGTEVVLIDDAYIRVASANGDELIYDVDNADGFLYNSGLSDDLAQEVADIQDLVESDEDGELELEATAAGQGGQGAPEDDNQDVVQSDPDEQDPTAPQAQDNNPPEKQQTDTAPQTQFNTASTAEDNSVAINVLKNVTTSVSGQLLATGVDNPALEFTAGVTFDDSQPSISGNLSATDADNADLAFVEATLVGSEGTLTIDPSGAWVYILDASAQSLALSEVITETFNVTLTDGSITPIVITVNGENDIPIISSATGSITEGVELSAGGQLIYTDVDSLDAHTFVEENLLGTLGSLSIDTNGNWLFTPNAAVESLVAGEVQTEVFTVSLSDGTQSTIQLDITGTDSLPVISSGAGVVVESVTPSISGTLTATGADNPDLLFLNATVNGDYGLLTISSNGAWNYELDARADALTAGETQTEILTVQLNDGSTTDVTISVTGTGSVPVISTGTGH